MNGYGDVGSAGEELWSTREELLLVCAVNRHGTKNWDSVAMEVQARLVSSFIVDPQMCRRRYYALRRRFSPEEREIDAISLLEELRRRRVDELRREVESCDVSITSLQHKVKKLEEDRERSFGDEKSGGGRSDPSENGGRKNETDVPEIHIENRGFNQGDSGQSSNESNSSEAKNERHEAVEKIDLLPGEEGKLEEEVSYDGSSDTVAKDIAHQPDVGESGESVAETRGEAAKENSDVQSSATVSRRRRGRRKSARGGSRSRGDEVSDGHLHNPAESQPLISFLEIFRSHEHGSIFEHRLKIQESPRYGSLIRQHMELAMVQRKLMEGRYAGDVEFYRDLLLLCTNAVIFFPKTSTEFSAAVELRRLVRHQIAAAIPNPSSSSSSPDPSALLQQTPLIACRKSEKEVSEEREGERVVAVATRRRRTEKKRSLLKFSERRNGGTLLESLKNSKKEIRVDEGSTAVAAGPVKRGVGRPPKRPPPGLLTPPPAKRTKAAPPQARGRRKK